MSDWQGIETAPRDGTEVLGFWSYLYEGDRERTCGMAVIQWEEYPAPLPCGWSDKDGIACEGVYSHWMPLPSPPNPGKQSGEG
jgi:hypothetical protein